MDIEREIRDFKLSLAFELDTWADAEKAKIRGMADRARRLFEPPLPSDHEFWLAMQNDLGHQRRSANYLYQQANANQQRFGADLNYSPLAWNPWSALLGNPRASPDDWRYRW